MHLRRVSAPSRAGLLVAQQALTRFQCTPFRLSISERKRSIVPAFRSIECQNPAIAQPRRLLSGTSSVDKQLWQSYDSSVSIEHAKTPPSSWYTSKDVLNAEKNSVFKTKWLVAGRADAVKSPGDYFTGTLLGEPYIICRDEEGKLRGFYNVCRHHGMCLADSGTAGRAKEFVCPYHGWTYALDGRLRRATRLKGIKDFSAPKFGLYTIHVEESGPWVFVNFSAALTPARAAPAGAAAGFAGVNSGAACGAAAGAPDSAAAALDLPTAVTGPITKTVPLPPPPALTLPAMLGDIPALMNRTGVGNLQFVRSKSYKLRCNWKVFVDNYLDGGYHVAHAHKGLASNLDLDNYRTTLHQYHSVQSCAAAAGSAPSDSGAVARVSGDAHYVYLYPNFMINRYGPWMDTNLVIPIDETHCEVVFDYYLDKSLVSNSAFIEESLNASEKVQDEDVYLCEKVQLGLESSAYPWGRYAPSVEFPMYHFHQLLHKDLQSVS